MAAQDKGRPLPKFGEWDVTNPASAEGFTVIFQKAREDKKTTNNPTNGPQTMQHNSGGLKPDQNYQYPEKPRRWWCCC